MSCTVRPKRTRLTVGRGLDSVGQGRDSDSETLLDLLQDLLVRLGRDERDRETLGTETASTTDTVQVRVGVRGRVLGCQLVEWMMPKFSAGHDLEPSRGS